MHARGQRKVTKIHAMNAQVEGKSLAVWQTFFQLYNCSVKIKIKWWSEYKMLSEQKL